MDPASRGVIGGAGPGEVRRWRALSPNPNSPEARNARLATIRSARRAPVPDRAAFIAGAVRGRRVLDVGVVDHTRAARRKAVWLHAVVSDAAADCLGVDILEDEVRELADAGYRVRVLDITSELLDPELEERFDVVVCGEVVEHLGSPETLFRTARRVLVPGGRLLLTTPNPFHLGTVFRHVFGREKDSADHVAFLFPSGVAELAEREGLRLDAIRGTLLETDSSRSRLLFRLRRLLSLIGARPECACTTIIYECVRPTEPSE